MDSSRALSAPLPARRRVLLATALLLAAAVAPVRAAGTPGEEPPRAAREPRAVRAIWVARWDYRTAEDVRQIVAACASLGLNRILFQVRGQADAYYRSSLEPWGESLEGAGTDGGPTFDPLRIALDEARRHGVELHAWVNVLPAWKGAVPPRSRSHLVHTHPGWFLVDQAGRRRLLERDSYALLNPCLPEVRAHLRSVLSELVALYALDGLQLDYVRFLDRDLRAGQDVPFDAATLRRFRAESGASPSERPEAWDRFRRGCLDALVEDLSAAVREKRPRMALSVAAIRDREHARSHLLQDVETWARRGWIDEVYPMAYEPDLTRFSHLVASWTRSRLEAPLVMGIGLHVLRDPRDLLEQVRRLEQPPPAGGRGPAGFCLFSYGELFLSRSPFVRRDRPAGERRSRLRAALGEL